MSSNFNNAKIINVYYNKGDRKPYDVNGKPIAYIGEEFVGSNEGSELRFFFGQDLDSATPMIITKRPDGQTYLDLCEKVGTGANSYYKVVLNNWYAEVKGKLTLIFKVYNGTVTLNEGNTEILSASGQVIVSDIFNLEVGYAPLATSAVPPYDPDPEASWYFALSQKLDKAQSITVTGALPTLTGDVYNDRYFYVEDEGVGRLYYINGSSAIEVVFQVGTLRLTPTGNGEVTADTGKLSWNQPNGTAQLGLYNDVNIGLGEDVMYYGKASATITKGQVIQYVGREGDHILIKPAVQSDINTNPKLIMGIAKQNIATGDFGYVAHFGKVDKINTLGQSANSFLYFNSGGTVPGQLTPIPPTAPNAKVLMAAIIKATTGSGEPNGVLQVRITIESKVRDLQDVSVGSVSNNQVLRWNNTNLRWENTNALTTAESDIDALEGRMTTAEGDIDSLEGRMTTAEGDIDDIEDGTTIVPKALADQNGNVINTTYLTIATGASTYVPLSSKGVANGVAPLDSGGKIPSIHLPGGVDDVQEYADLASFPDPGEASIIYVALDTNKVYRWGGSEYVEISASLALGETSSTAHRGDLGKIAYDHSQIITGNPHGTSASDVGAEPANANIQSTVTTVGNIINGTQGLTNTRITNSAVGTIPLIVNGVASTTANLQEWRDSAGIARTGVEIGGDLFAAGVRNFSNTNNAWVQTVSTGVIIRRNIADANHALIVNQVHASSTGDILRLQSAGANVLEITRTGGLRQNGLRLFSQPVNNTNTFFGTNSGGTSTTGTGNDAFGNGALNVLTTGNGNTAIGHISLVNNISGGQNVMVGVAAGSLITSSSNTSIGYNSSSSITTGQQNTFLGHTAGTNASQLATATNSTGIGFQAYTDKSNQMVFGNESVTEFKFDRNASATMLLPQVETLSANLHTNERTTNVSSSTLSVLRIMATTSADMGDGFGGNLLFQAKDSANTAFSLAQIGAIRSGGDTTGRLSFQTNNVGSLTEKMTILPDGNVGIGTTAPATKLSVVTEASTNSIQVRRNSTTANEYATLGFRIATTDGGNFAEIRAVRTNRAVGADTDLRFITFSNSNFLESMRIRDDGLVGINETTLSAQLTVKSGATDRVGLAITTTATTGHTANIATFSANNAIRALIQPNGQISTLTGISNASSINNANVALASTGTTISRNVADDSNPALIVNLTNATSTGHIQVWQSQTDAKAHITRTGIFVGQSRPTRTDITANATLALADEGKVLRVNPTTAADNITITIPKNSAVAFPIDTEIAIVRYNSGTVSIAPVDGDVTLQSANAERKIKNRYGSVALKKVATDEWVLVGSLEA